VMTFLSARDTPIARRFEIWVPTQERDSLIFHSGDCDQSPDLANDYQSARIGKFDGLIGQVWLTGVAGVREGLSDEPSPTARSAAAVGLHSMVAVPIMNDQAQSRAVVALYF